MRAQYLMTLVASILALNYGMTGEPKSEDAKNIQGTWKIVSVDGPEKPGPEELKKLRISIIKDELIVQVDGKKINASTFKLAPSKKPKEIDLVVEVLIDKKVAVESSHEPRQGIYELTGDDLKICFAWAPQKKTPDPSARPKEFKTGGDLMVLTLKRDK
jgi:uncharacterized protein (TIGR03067 family)